MTLYEVVRYDDRVFGPYKTEDSAKAKCKGIMSPYMQKGDFLRFYRHEAHGTLIGVVMTEEHEDTDSRCVIRKVKEDKTK